MTARPSTEARHPTRAAPHPVRRVAAAAGAVALVLPFLLGVGALPASAAGPTSSSVSGSAGAASVLRPVDHGWYGSPYGGYGSGGGLPYGGYSSAPSTTTSSLDTTVATATQSAGLALVSTTLDFGEGEAAGTGLVIGSDGIIVTNHHVVADSTDIEVTVAETGETYAATYVGGDAARDIAVLRLTGARGLTTVDTDTELATGDPVVAVGDAGGDGGSLTASAGSVLKLRKAITVSDELDGTTSRLRGLIEVDADVISGDSGGALLNADGQVVAMNVAASSGSAAITGYAIPVARVLRVADAILSGDDSGSVVLGYDAFLGVELTNGSTSPRLAGVIDGTAAATAGLVVGDSIIRVDGTRVATSDALVAAPSQHSAGDLVVLTWTDTTGATQRATVTLGTAPIA